MIAHSDHLVQMATMRLHLPFGKQVLWAGSCYFLCSEQRVPGLRQALKAMTELQHLRVSVERMGGTYQTSWIAFAGTRVVRSCPASQTQTLEILGKAGLVLVRLRFSALEAQVAFEKELKLGEGRCDDQKLLMSAAEKVLQKVRCASRSYAKPPILELWCINEDRSSVDGFIW